MSDDDIKLVLEKYDRKNPKADMTGLHFNKAENRKYKFELTTEQLSVIHRELGPEIKLMGYDI